MNKKNRSQQYLIIYTAFSLLLSVGSYYFLDKPITRFFHALAGSKVEMIFDYITEFGEGFYWIVYPGGIYLIYRISKKITAGPAWLRKHLEEDREFRMQAMAFVAMVAVISGIAVNLLKLVFARYRPIEYFLNDKFGFSWFDYGYRIASFPSGHSATALSVALAFALIFPRFKFVIMALGVLVLFSRVVVVEHYLSDVIMGGYVGVITTLYLYQKFYMSKLARSLPKN